MSVYGVHECMYSGLQVNILVCEGMRRYVCIHVQAQGLHQESSSLSPSFGETACDVLIKNLTESTVTWETGL